jgi:hypothetical protein
MSTAFTLPDPGPPNLDFERPADRAHLDRTAAALAARGFKAQVADTAANARELALGAIPLGPGGGAGLLGDGVADSAQIAELKGRDMGIDTYSSLFEAVPALAP